MHSYPSEIRKSTLEYALYLCRGQSACPLGEKRRSSQPLIAVLDQVGKAIGSP